jgi:hypothetical protein
MSEDYQASVSKGPEIKNPGPLTRNVLAYDETMRRLIPHIKTQADWAPLEEFVALDEFERVGCFLEVQNWAQYRDMLTGWAGHTAKFETSVRRIAELPGHVYYEIEERHFRGGKTDIVNSMTVFAFNEAGKICHLDVFLQQPAR